MRTAFGHREVLVKGYVHDVAICRRVKCTRWSKTRPIREARHNRRIVLQPTYIILFQTKGELRVVCRSDPTVE